MVSFNVVTSILWALVVSEFAGWSVGFSVAPRSLLVQPAWLASTSLFVKDMHSVSPLLDDQDLESRGGDDLASDFLMNHDMEPSQDIKISDESSSGSKQRPEYGAMSPGTVVQVQIGDLSLARKAWKKRRRTGSPLLVPCSVLSADHRSMVRWNLIFLLEKFGKSQADGIQITASELTKRYRVFLKSSLQVRRYLVMI